MALFCCLVVCLLLEKINEGKAYLNCVQHYLWAVHSNTQSAIRWDTFWSLRKVKICPQGTSGGCVCITVWWWDSRSWLSATLDGVGGLDPSVNDRLQYELLGWGLEVFSLRDTQLSSISPTRELNDVR